MYTTNLQPDQSINLVKPGVSFPSFSSFEHIEPKELSLGRREGLHKDVYSVLLRNRLDMTDEARAWWTKNVIGEINSSV